MYPMFLALSSSMNHWILSAYITFIPYTAPHATQPTALPTLSSVDSGSFALSKQHHGFSLSKRMDGPWIRTAFDLARDGVQNLATSRLAGQQYPAAFCSGRIREPVSVFVPLLCSVISP